jgi:hypothetical protein
MDASQELTISQELTTSQELTISQKVANAIKLASLYVKPDVKEIFEKLANFSDIMQYTSETKQDLEILGNSKKNMESIYEKRKLPKTKEVIDALEFIILSCYSTEIGDEFFKSLGFETIDTIKRLREDIKAAEESDQGMANEEAYEMLDALVGQFTNEFANLRVGGQFSDFEDKIKAYFELHNMEYPEPGAKVDFLPTEAKLGAKVRANWSVSSSDSGSELDTSSFSAPNPVSHLDSAKCDSNDWVVYTDKSSSPKCGCCRRLNYSVNIFTSERFMVRRTSGTEFLCQDCAAIIINMLIQQGTLKGKALTKDENSVHYNIKSVFKQWANIDHDENWSLISDCADKISARTRHPQVDAKKEYRGKCDECYLDAFIGTIDGDMPFGDLCLTCASQSVKGCIIPPPPPNSYDVRYKGKEFNPSITYSKGFATLVKILFQQKNKNA